MRLKEIRKERGLKQKEIAKLIGISPMAYSYYEREERQPDIKTLKKISELFNVPVDYIIENENERLEKLTDEERKIINKYRKLCEKNKNKIEERIDVLLENQEENFKKVS